MESSNNFSKAFSAAAIVKIINAVFPFSDFFYILQLEEYSGARFLKWLPRFFWRRNFQVRDRLKYTQRAKSSMIFVVAVWFASFLAVAAVCFSFRFIPTLIMALVWVIAIPFFVLAGNWVLSPYFNYRKKSVMRRAAATVRQHGGLKIVAVAGSFGKTTVKNFIYQLVRYNYATQMVSGNINTSLGIAMWVNAYLKPGTQLLIVEMDAYRRGEIAASAAVAPADIAIITNIGDQHLERFGSRTALAAALREVFVAARTGANLLCTEETATAVGKEWGKGRALTIVSDDALKIIPSAVKKNYSASNQVNLAFAVSAAQMLQIPRDFIIDTCAKLELPERRQKEAEWHGYTAIDDSYNISLTTARAGVAAAAELAKREGKKLLVVTAGIPELGPQEKNGNEKLGELITSRADHAAVLKSVFAGEIVRGVRQYNKVAARVGKNVTVFRNLEAFLAKATAQFSPEEWVVLVQPELTDLYY